MIALYPGAYKPPHRGHFNVVKSLLDNSYNGSVYDKDNYKEKGADLLKGRSNKKPKVDKVLVPLTIHENFYKSCIFVICVQNYWL